MTPPTPHHPPQPHRETMLPLPCLPPDSGMGDVPLDESGLGGGAASTYVRMMQPHGGTTEGFHFPLRKVTIGANEDRSVGGYYNLDCGGGTTLETPLWTNDVAGLTSIKTGTMIQKSSDTQLNLGTTHLDWKATDGTIAKLDLNIPGGATITTPSWKVIDPKRDVISAFLQDTCGCKLAVHQKKIGLHGLKIDISGVYVSSFGFKLDNRGVLKQTNSARLFNVGSSLPTGGLQVLTFGLLTIG